jgi:hypothetical protein
VSITARQLTVDCFFTLAAYGTSRQLSALLTGHETARAESLQYNDHGHTFGSLERSVRRE